MTEYFKKEDAIEAVTSLFRMSALFSGMNDNENEWREKSEKVLGNLPTIDIVNCIECEYLGDDWWCYKHEFTPIPIEDYFCKDREGIER